MFFFFPHTYQGPEIRAVFNALRNELLEEIEINASNLSWTEEEYNKALEELLPCMVDLANRKYSTQQAMVTIRNYACCGSISVMPLKLCILYVLFCGLNEDDYFDYIKREFKGIIASVNLTLNRNLSYDIERLKKFTKPEDDFFKIKGSEYNDLYNKYTELVNKHEELERKNQNLSLQIHTNDKELAKLKKHANLNTLVDYMVENDAKPEEKEVISNILSRMFIKDQNEEVKEAYDRLNESISADKKMAQGGNTYVSVGPGGMNIENIGHVDKLGPKS